MSEIVVGLLGLLTVIGIVITLFKTKTMPSIAFIAFPMALAVILVLGGYYSLDNVASLIKSGFGATAPTAALFVFSVMYFGIMTDAGMFDVIIGALMKLIKNNVMGICILTCIISIVGHLDGGGASTFLIVVPALLPVYKKLHMKPTVLLRITVASMGVMNLLPYAGPTLRAATVVGIESSALYKEILPIQIVGIICAFGVAILSGLFEQKRIAGLDLSVVDRAETESEQAEAKKKNELARPKLFWFNLILTACIIALLIYGIFPDYVPFMIGTAIALLVNYTPIKQQKEVFRSHSGPALMMCSTLMAAGVLMGIFVQTVSLGGGLQIPSVMTCLSDVIRNILPAFLQRHIAIVIGILSVPLALCFDTDSYFYGVLPVMIGIGNNFGVDPVGIAVAMVVCRNCATFISPMVPATLLGVGLADVDIKDHVKSSFLWIWGISVICLIISIFIGRIPL